MTTPIRRFIFQASLAIILLLHLLGMSIGPPKKPVLYILERRGDVVYLKIGHTDFKEYPIDSSSVNIRFEEYLNESYFIDKSRLVLSGRCVVDINKLKTSGNFLYCAGEYANRVNGKSYPFGNLTLLDATNIESEMKVNPYRLNFYNRDLQKLVSVVTVDNDQFNVTYNKGKISLPNYLALNQYKFFKAYPDFASCRVRLLDLRTGKSKDIVTFDLTQGHNVADRVGKDTSTYYYSHSLDWSNESEVTYVTGTIIDERSSQLSVWRYRIGEQGPEVIYSFGPADRLDFPGYRWTGKYKAHLYNDNILTVDDHEVSYNSLSEKRKAIYRTKGPNDIIIDAILVE